MRRRLAIGAGFLGRAVLLATPLLVAISPTAAQATVRYARVGGLASGSCDSWAAACTLAYLASLPNHYASGDEVWVAQGVHTPASTSGFQFYWSVTVYGGFPAVGTPGMADRNPDAYPTILSGDIAGDDPNTGGVVMDWEDNLATGADNAHNVVYLNAAGTFDGVTITAGNGPATGGGAGAGMMAYYSAAPLVLRNVVFRGNRSDTAGGGLYLNNTTGSALVENVKFIGNAAKQGGGVTIYATTVTFEHVLFQDNDAVRGGIWHMGGAISGQLGTDSTDTSHLVHLSDVQLLGNTSADWDCAFDFMYGVVFLDRVTFRGNGAAGAASGHCAVNGSQVVRMDIVNSLIAGNLGTGVSLSATTLTLTNVTVTGNTGYGLSVWGNVTVRNSILWGNGDVAHQQTGGSLAVDYSLVQGGCPAIGSCTQVLDASPAFVSPVNLDGAPTTAGDLHLLPSSPAVDTGDNTVVDPLLPTIDLDGGPRRVDATDTPDGGKGDPPIVDMGAYEYSGTAPNLTVDKTNDVGGTARLGEVFTWILDVHNTGTDGSGSAVATFADGQVVLQDNLPSDSTSYGPPVVDNWGGLSGNLVCWIIGSDLTCTAIGPVSLTQTGRFQVLVPVVPLALGTLTNPRSGGSCSVDPGNVIAEFREDDNTCTSDVVTVGKGMPTMACEMHDASHAAVTSAPLGAPIHGRVTVAGPPPPSTVQPTGDVTLELFENASCSGTPAATYNSTLQDGVAESVAFSAFTHYYRFSYLGDESFNSVGGDCVYFLATQATAITSARSATFTPGVAGSFTVTTTGSPTGPAMSIGASGALPTGVTFTDSRDGTATLAGTPAAGSAGVYRLVVTAANGIAPDATQSFTLTVTGPNRTTTTLVSSRNPAPSGYPVRFTARVSFYTRTAGVPTGSVELWVDGARVGAPVPLTSCQASFPPLTLAPGQHAVVARYVGDSSFAPSLATVQQHVGGA